MLEMLARLARPLALASAFLLVVGVTLTGLNLLLVGWSLYTAGYAGAIAALAAVGAVNRARMGGWAWLGLLVLLVGLVLGLLPVGSIWQGYSQGGGWLSVAGRAMQLPVWTPPIGLTAELVTWVGLAFFALAARGARALPTATGWLFVGAAVVGIVAALYVVSPYSWVAAVVLLAVGLLGIGTSLHQSEVALTPRRT